MAKAKKKMSPKKPAAKAVAKKSAPKKMAPIKSAGKINLSNFMSPLDDRLVVQPSVIATMSPGGLYLPDSADKSMQVKGLVLAVGPGHRDKKGRTRPMDVKVGDSILYPQHAGDPITILGNDVQILRESEVLALLLDTKR